VEATSTAAASDASKELDLACELAAVDASSNLREQHSETVNFKN